MRMRGQVAHCVARCGVSPRAPRRLVSFFHRIACPRPDQDLPHDQVASPVASRLRPCGAGCSRPAGRSGQHAAGTPGSPARHAAAPSRPAAAPAPPVGPGAEPAAADRPAPAPSAHGPGLRFSAPRPRRHDIRCRPFPGRPIPTRPGSLRGFGPSARSQRCGRAFLFLGPQAPAPPPAAWLARRRHGAPGGTVGRGAAAAVRPHSPWTRSVLVGFDGCRV